MLYLLKGGGSGVLAGAAYIASLLLGLTTLLSPPPMGVSDYFTVMFGGASLEYPDAFPWWSYYQTGGTGNINVPYVSNYSAIFAEGAEITDSWLPFYSPQSLVDWNEDYLISVMNTDRRASLVPAAAVIPAPIVYIKVGAVKMLVV